MYIYLSGAKSIGDGRVGASSEKKNDDEAVGMGRRRRRSGVCVTLGGLGTSCLECRTSYVASTANVLDGGNVNSRIVLSKAVEVERWLRGI